MKARHLATILSLLFGSTAIFAFGSQHSKLESKVTKTGNNVEVIFMVHANADMEITVEAPWSLDVSNMKNLSSGDNNQISINEFDPSISGMRLNAQLQNEAEPFSFNYKMKAFVCTKDKKRCYPQTHKGTFVYDFKAPKPKTLAP